jgi:hypothetical protein
VGCFSFEQERQRVYIYIYIYVYIYNVTLRGVREATVAVEKQLNTTYLCVCGDAHARG